MHISLTKNLDNLVKSKVKSGLYNNASEVVREALRMMHEKDKAQEARYEHFKREVILGVEAAERGEFSERTPQEIIRDLENRHDVS